MTELILKWLNEEVILSRKVHSFEEDFANGFLLGELLHKHNQQLNFPLFRDSAERIHRLNNYELLYPTLSSLGINFNHNTANSLMRQESGAAEFLLYELKMALEKVNQQIARGKAVSLAPLKKIPQSKPQFDRLNYDTFRLKLNETNPSQKEINLRSHLARFEEKGAAHDRIIEERRKADSKDKRTFVEENRLTALATLKKQREFSRNWEQKGLEEHASNMQRKMSREHKEMAFRTQRLDRLSSEKARRQAHQQNEIRLEINEFEDRHGFKPEDEEERASSRPESGRRARMSRTAGVETAQAQSLQHEHYAANDRGKRRRKLIVDQLKHQQVLQLGKREQAIFQKLNQESRQEKEIVYEVWRAQQQKLVILSNRELREQRYHEQKERFTDQEGRKEEHLLRFYHQEYQEDLALRSKRLRELEVEQRVLVRKQNYSNCKDMLTELLTMVQIFYDHQQQNNSRQIESRFHLEQMRLFAQGKPLLKIGHERAQSLKALAALERKDYLQARCQWQFAVERKDEPTQPALDNALPDKACNNSQLGNILRHVYREILPPPRQCVFQPTPALKVLLGGLSFAGKNKLASQLSGKFGFVTCTIEQLLQRKLGQTGPVGTELREFVNRGQPIQDRLLAEIVCEQLKGSSSVIVVDFPKTASQLKELLWITNPEEFAGKSELELRCEGFSRVVEHDPLRVVPKRVKPVGVDLFIWLDISKEESLKRALAKRVNASGEVVDLFEVTRGQVLTMPDDLCAATIEINAQKTAAFAELRDWLSLYGQQAMLKKETPSAEELAKLDAIPQQSEGEENKEEDSEEVLLRTWQSIRVCEEPTMWAEAEQLVHTMTRIREAALRKREQEEQEHREKQKRVEEQQKHAEQQLQRFMSTPKSQVEKLLSEEVMRSALDKEVFKLLAKLWQGVEEKYLAASELVFTQARQQRERMNGRCASLRQRFIAQVSRQDGKLQLVKEYQQGYNAMLDKWFDICEEDSTKEELHQRVEDLQDRLLAIATAKKEEASEERKSIQRSGWVEGELERLLIQLQALLQAELEYFFVTQQLVTDYYLAQDGRDKESPPALVPVELDLDEAAELISAAEESPRMDKLFSEAQRISNQEEAALPLDDKSKKGAKAPPPKKEDKKAPKKEDEKRELTANEQEAKKVLNTQKAILRFRLQMLRKYGKRRLKQMVSQSQQLSNLLEDVEEYTFSCEKSAISQLCMIFRRAIEKEQKIQNEVQLNFVDVVVSQRLLNFFTPPPRIQPAAEEPQSKRFSVSGLESLTRKLHALASGDCIQDGVLLALFTRSHNSLVALDELPGKWHEHTPAQYKRMVARLDPENVGTVSCSHLCTFLVLSSCSFPSREDIDRSLPKTFTHSTFLQQTMWFDAAENPARVENRNLFERARHLRRLVWSQLERKGEVTAERVRETLLATRYVGGRQPKSYYDLLFG